MIDIWPSAIPGVSMQKSGVPPEGIFLSTRWQINVHSPIFAQAENALSLMAKRLDACGSGSASSLRRARKNFIKRQQTSGGAAT